MAASLAICFIALIECITYIHNNSAGLYLNWLYILYAYTSIAFSILARKYNYSSMYGYLLFATVHMIFAFFDTLIEFNAIVSNELIENNYVNVMITLIAILIILSWHDRVHTFKHRTNCFMSKPVANPNLYSEISK
jgi:hypothetical protein